MSVRYFCEEVDFKLAHPRTTTAWLKVVVQKERASISSVSYIFCSDSFLLKLNQDFLSHNTLTDIITFDYSPSKKALDGEVYISLDRVAENALKFKSTIDEELHRVVVHGMLHLIGYKDKTKANKLLMRKKEDAYLSLRRIKVPRGTNRD